MKLSFTAKENHKEEKQRQLLSLLLREKKIAFYKRHVNTVQTTIVITTMIWLNECCTFISFLDRNFGLASQRHEWNDILKIIYIVYRSEDYLSVMTVTETKYIYSNCSWRKHSFVHFGIRSYFKLLAHVALMRKYHFIWTYEQIIQWQHNKVSDDPVSF